MNRILLILFMVSLTIVTNGNTIRVDKNGNFQTLKDAIRFSKPFDTILVSSGMYSSVNTFVNKPLTLIGVGEVLLNGFNKDDILIIQSNHVTVSGFKLINSATGNLKDFAGIRIQKSKHIRIHNCDLSEMFFGIYISDSRNVQIIDNSSKGKNGGQSNSGNGIHLWKCDSILIRGNHLSGHRDGVYFEFAKHCRIENNLSEKNFRYGLHFMFSDDDVYEKNIFRNNGTGVAVMYTKNVSMISNRFEENWGDASYGLLLKDIKDSKIHNNSFYNNTVGITMEGSSRINFNNNDFTMNGFALKIWANCIQDTFYHNNFSGNTFDASTNGQLELNSFDFNYWDKYEGYDLNHDKVGDISFNPVSLYSMLIEQVPFAVILLRSFIVYLIDIAEKNIPYITPQAFQDNHPVMTRIAR
ncbi:MAG: nitrous oxide reductase family maturation protein NosD [Flavobacteriales bacterium]|nr:nitrous oxide reductase family maturation protein NosD [Flavobacteriales bacterium]